MKGQSAFFKTVCALAVPAALQSMLQSSFSMVDQIMIGQLAQCLWRSSGGGAGWTGWAAQNELSKKQKKQSDRRMAIGLFWHAVRDSNP